MQAQVSRFKVEEHGFSMFQSLYLGLEIPKDPWDYRCVGALGAQHCLDYL